MNKYSSINDVAFLEQVKNWIDSSGEIYVNVGFSQAGGVNVHIICTSYEAFVDVLKPLKGKRGAITVLRHPFFKIRGVANETLLKQAISIFSDGEDWFLICPDEKSPYNSFGFGDRTHGEMQKLFQRVEGRFVVIGDDKDFPPDEDRDDVLVTRFNL